MALKTATDTPVRMSCDINKIKNRGKKDEADNAPSDVYTDNKQESVAEPSSKIMQIRRRLFNYMVQCEEKYGKICDKKATNLKIANYIASHPTISVTGEIKEESTPVKRIRRRVIKEYSKTDDIDKIQTEHIK